MPDYMRSSQEPPREHCLPAKRGESVQATFAVLRNSPLRHKLCQRGGSSRPFVDLGSSLGRSPFRDRRNHTSRS